MSLRQKPAAFGTTIVAWDSGRLLPEFWRQPGSAVEDEVETFSINSACSEAAGNSREELGVVCRPRNPEVHSPVELGVRIEPVSEAHVEGPEMGPLACFGS